MLGFRAHFLTKSRAYSITFGAIRQERRTWRLRHELDLLGADIDDPGDVPVDLDAVTVINDWLVVHIGHRDHIERELALAIAIAERHRAQRRTTHRSVRSAA